MKKEVTAVVKEYLETIYRLEEESRVARTSDLVNVLGLKPRASLETLEKAPFNGPLTLKAGSINRAVSRATASVIQVKRTT